MKACKEKQQQQQLLCVNPSGKVRKKAKRKSKNLDYALVDFMYFL